MYAELTPRCCSWRHLSDLRYHTSPVLSLACAPAPSWPQAPAAGCQTASQQATHSIVLSGDTQGRLAAWLAVQHGACGHASAQLVWHCELWHQSGINCISLAPGGWTHIQLSVRLPPSAQLCLCLGPWPLPYCSCTCSLSWSLSTFV